LSAAAPLQRCPYRHIHPQVFDAAEPGTGSPGSRAAAVSSASSRKSPSARAHGSPVRPGVPRTPSASSTGEASGGASLTVASSAPAVPSCRRWRRNFRCTDAACPSLHPVNIYAAVPDVADPRRDGMPLPDDHVRCRWSAARDGSSGESHATVCVRVHAGGHDCRRVLGHGDVRYSRRCLVVQRRDLCRPLPARERPAGHWRRVEVRVPRCHPVLVVRQEEERASGGARAGAPRCECHAR
jgi:hypothetical protein